MRIIVTGGHGFIGHHVCNALVGRHEVYSADRIEGARSFKDDRVRVLDQRVERCEVDLSKPAAADALFRVVKPEVVIHMAGQYSISEAPDQTQRYIEGNVLAFINVMESALAHKTRRVLYASSIAVSDKGKPSSLYGAFKAMNEHAAHAYSRRGLEVIGLRYAAVYGPMMRRDADLYRAAEQLVTGKKISWTKSFEQPKEWVRVEDAAALTVALAECTMGVEKSPVILVDGPDARTDLGVVLKHVATLAKCPLRLPSAYRPMNLKAVTPNPIWDRLGVPRMNLVDGLQGFVEWLMSETRAR